MNDKNGYWELMILDGKIDNFTDTGCLATGDIDGDGRQELFIGGNGGLVWYRPETFEKGFIAERNYHVTIALEDVDCDGLLELFVGEDAGEGMRW